MAEDFEAAVEDGLHLSKRLYYGKDRAVTPPKPPSAMERPAGRSLLPTSPMVYAVISDPAIVDNPDMPSYQPHVHGRCHPPALIPLQMNGISVEVDCYMDMAFVTVSGSWRLHCVMGSRSCDCRIAVPMGEQGSILGVDVEVPRISYSTQLNAVDNDNDKEKVAKIDYGAFLKPHIFTLTVPKIDGGTNLQVKLRWSQKLFYHDDQFSLNVPFSFPDYVNPAGTKISKHEKIHLNVNFGPGTEILSKTMSHPLKERTRKSGNSSFLYEADVLTWSSSDFMFTYTTSPSDTFGTVLLTHPSSTTDDGEGEIFCCYIHPGTKLSEKVFRREVVFVVDISGSMRGKVLDDTKNALFAALGKLDPEDLFNVIAFNGETYLFSSSLEQATSAAIENATQWIILNFVAGGGTNMLLPLNQAIEMFSDNNRKSIPIIFLITDGSVEDERHICDSMKSQLTNRENVVPRIYTFGIGIFSNHYFLRMLSMVGQGYHDAAFDVDSIEVRIGRLFARASSVVLANIAFENIDEVDDLEVFPSRIPDLSSESPLVVSGRYHGTFPEILKVKGVLPDMTTFSEDLKVRDAGEIPVSKMLAKQEVELLTAEAWYADKKELEEKVANMSVQNGIISEYSHVILLETNRGKTIPPKSATGRKATSKVGPQHETEEPKPQKIRTLHETGLGFGNLTATAENIPPGYTSNSKLPDATEASVNGASNCCGKLFSPCCCMCCITTCSKMNDQCAIILTQLCGALACLSCYSCCASCCSGQHG